MSSPAGSPAGAAVVTNWEQKFRTLQTRYDDFQKSSGELEQELTAEAERATSECERATRRVEQLTAEITHLRTALSDAEHVSQRNAANLRASLAAVSTERDDLKRSIRAFEQTVDDRERANRIHVSTIAALEVQLDHAQELLILEKTAHDDTHTRLTMIEHELRAQLKDEHAHTKMLNDRYGGAPTTAAGGGATPATTAAAATSGGATAASAGGLSVSVTSASGGTSSLGSLGANRPPPTPRRVSTAATPAAGAAGAVPKTCYRCGANLTNPPPQTGTGIPPLIADSEVASTGISFLSHVLPVCVLTSLIFIYAACTSSSPSAAAAAKSTPK